MIWEETAAQIVANAVEIIVAYALHTMMRENTHRINANTNAHTN